MAEFMVLFAAGAEQSEAELHLADQIEAFLPIQFPDDSFRFGLAPGASAGISVVRIAGHQDLGADNLSEISLAIEEMVRSESRSTAL